MKNIKDAEALINQAIKVLGEKQKDYGSQNITIGGNSGLVVRMLDKVMRIKNLLESKEEPNFESIDDTFLDLLNYSAIGAMLSRGQWKDSKSYLVYLCGPIDSVSLGVATGWRGKVQEELYNITSFFDPAQVFTACSADVAEKVVQINREAIKKCDILFCDITAGRYFESIREIEFARTLNKPVICVCGDIKSFGMYDIQTYETLDEGISALKLWLGDSTPKKGFTFLKT